MEKNEKTPKYNEKIIEVPKSHLSEFNICQKIEYGRSGLYYFVNRKKKTDEFFIIKVMSKSKILKKNQVDRLIKEIKLHKTLSKSLFFPKILYVDVTDHRYFTYFFEFIPGGTLKCRLEKKGKFPTEDAQFYAAGILKMLEYLHKSNYIYRDLNPQNILINYLGYLCFLSIAFIKELKKNEKTYTILSYPKYLAPEVILGVGYNKGVDYWALGIILYEMLIGNAPYISDDPLLIYQKILQGHLKFHPLFDRDAKNLIQNLLNPNPKLRFGCLRGGASDIIEHRFFDNFDWEQFNKYTMEAPFKPEQDYYGALPNFNVIHDKLEDLTKHGEETENIDDKNKDKNLPRKSKDLSIDSEHKVNKDMLKYLAIDPEAEELSPENDIFYDW